MQNRKNCVGPLDFFVFPPNSFGLICTPCQDSMEPAEERRAEEVYKYAHLYKMESTNYNDCQMSQN